MNNNPNPEEFTEVYNISVYKKNEEDPTKWEYTSHPFPEEIMTPEFTNKIQDALSDIFPQGMHLTTPTNPANYPTIIKNFWNVEVNDAIRPHLYKLKPIPNNDMYRFMISLDNDYSEFVFGENIIHNPMFEGLHAAQIFPDEIVINPDSPFSLPEGFDIIAQAQAQLQQAGGKRRAKKHTKTHRNKTHRNKTHRSKPHRKTHRKTHTKKHTKATRKTRRN